MQDTQRLLLIFSSFLILCLFDQITYDGMCFESGLRVRLGLKTKNLVLLKESQFTPPYAHLSVKHFL